jgi:hypothetical protein
MVWENDIAPEASKRINRWGGDALLTLGHLELWMQGNGRGPVVPDSRRDRTNFILGYRSLHGSGGPRDVISSLLTIIDKCWGIVVRVASYRVRSPSNYGNAN